MSHKTTNLAELAAFITPDKIAYAVMLRPRRIGALAFITFLEYRHFPPLPEDKDFNLAPVLWEGMHFVVVVIPKAREAVVAPILTELGLRVADGVPTLITAKGLTHFAINLPNLFTIENVPGHFAYENDPEKMRIALAAENEAIEREQAAMQAAMQARWRGMKEAQNQSNL